MVIDLTVRRVHPVFAAELLGIDLGEAINTGVQQAISDAMDEHSVVVLSDQPLDATEIDPHQEKQFGTISVKLQPV